MIRYLRAKLHNLYVTGADLHYHGSVTLDPEICQKAGILPLEFVEIWNKNSGARLDTYVIYGDPGSGCCIMNGAAARTCQPGDPVIIAACGYGTPEEVLAARPRVLTFDADNALRESFIYESQREEWGRISFCITPEGAVEG